MHLFCIEIMWIALWLTISIVILLDGYNYLILNKYSIIVYIKSIHPYIAPLNIVNAFSVHYIVIYFLESGRYIERVTESLFYLLYYKLSTNMGMLCSNYCWSDEKY